MIFIIVFFFFFFLFFFFNDTATTEIYTLSLHDALPISPPPGRVASASATSASGFMPARSSATSEEHTSELQSRENLVCPLLLEKKKNCTKAQQAHNEHELSPRVIANQHTQ